ncbi:outer membrane transport energization protein TonB [Hoeflea halophila]|uniref:Outer membrane transport energization protein TonB n=1 Tax=Hoeflea halophila TaxID=714899 RepID=A0A286IFF2_9HYPH|nr:energy transducer TonB [Hoeflea halophila]SOE18873.1 outer membrane transport energization protein TonB [Hoeflea halophila]
MITSASRLRVAAVVAVLASSLLHVGAMAIAPQISTEVSIAGSKTEQSAALGSNFADLVKAGDELSPLQTDQTEFSEPVATPPVKPVETSAVEPVSPASQAAVPAPEFRVEPSQAEGLVPPAAPEKLEAVKPEAAAVQSPAERSKAVDPEPAQAIKPVETAETVTPLEELKNIPTPVAKPRQKPREKPKKTSAGTRKAKSNVKNKSGKQDGQKSAKAAMSGKSIEKSAFLNAGNAAASNYAGKVYARIARTRQRNAGGRGVVQVRFNVSPSGQAVRISVARSSGNARVDSAAVAHVKRASPFPKPPSGAQTRFVIPIEFRR